MGGIRTLGTLMRYTRFPIVLVMTASIPLRTDQAGCLAVTRGIIAASAPMSRKTFRISQIFFREIFQKMENALSAVRGHFPAPAATVWRRPIPFLGWGVGSAVIECR